MRQIRYVYLVVMDAFYTFLADDGWAIASHIALSALMALFPFLIVLTSLAGFFGSKELADQARSMDKLTVAEFVEDAASMSILFSCGVNFVQGNFLQEPEKVMSYDFG